MTIKNVSDSSLNSAIKPGMVLLNTTSFSGVSSASVNNVFSAAYENYLVRFYGTMVTANDYCSLRLRVGGVDNATAGSYGRQALEGVGGTAQAFSTTATSYGVAVKGGTTSAISEIRFFRPFTTSSTFFHNFTGDYLNTITQTGFHNQTVSYDGFTLISNAGTNFTATIVTYGWNQ